MFERLAAIEETFEEITRQLSDPEVLADQSKYTRLAKQHRELSGIVDRFHEYKAIKEGLQSSRGLLADTEMAELAKEDIAILEQRLERCEEDLKLLLLPEDPLDEKNVLLEIRAGTGGEEAALFAREILRMYSRCAESKRWNLQILDLSETGLGGVKEAVALIEGNRVYSRLKHESGVHRVQRVPATEASGRIHTSAVTVAVLPEADEVDVRIDPKDVRVDTFCSSGPGGQSVNTTYSAVRLTHQPTGLVVSCQDEKSQIKNREKALRVLRSRLLEMERQKQQDAISAERRSQVGSGDRSEKIRTYNFKENRVTDHRIGFTTHTLDLFMNGEIDELIDALVTYYQAEKLKEQVVTSA